MVRSKQTRYPQEVKAQAVRMAVDDGIGIAETARRLSISSKTLANWVTQAKQAPQRFTRQGENVGQDVELQRLRKENVRLRMECEILKKVTAYFAKKSLCSTPQYKD